MHIKRNCAICGAEYWTRSAKSKYCEACKTIAERQRQSRFREAHPNYHSEKSKQWRADHAQPEA